MPPKKPTGGRRAVACTVLSQHISTTPNFKNFPDEIQGLSRTRENPVKRTTVELGTWDKRADRWQHHLMPPHISRCGIIIMKWSMTAPHWDWHLPVAPAPSYSDHHPGSEGVKSRLRCRQFHHRSTDVRGWTHGYFPNNTQPLTKLTNKNQVTKRPPCHFLNNSVKNKPITTIDTK